jgi:hypothetical protein
MRFWSGFYESGNEEGFLGGVELRVILDDDGIVRESHYVTRARQNVRFVASRGYLKFLPHGDLSAATRRPFGSR